MEKPVFSLLSLSTSFSLILAAKERLGQGGEQQVFIMRGKSKEERERNCSKCKGGMRERERRE